MPVETRSRDLVLTMLALFGMVAASFLLIALTASVSISVNPLPVAF